MKKILCWISIRLVCVAALFSLTNNSITQVLWGMTSDGGSKKTGGNLFSINADGSGFIERYNFLNDNAYVRHQRLLDYGDGFLYGANSQMLYRVRPDGSSYEALYLLNSYATGYYPFERLMKGNDGYLYGTTNHGGNHDRGVIFKAKKDGTDYQILYHFTGTIRYQSHLIQFDNGTIFGTAELGGTHDKGIVYKIDPDGSNFQVLHNFNGTNGSGPSGGLVGLTVNGITYLYGLTNFGGTNDAGVIYRIQPNGNNYSRQYNFSPQSTGRYPTGSLIKIGNVLYGATTWGGNTDGGIVFAYDADADSYQNLHVFTKSTDPTIEYNPIGPLLNYNGKLYGIASTGGSLREGVLFRLNYDGSNYQVIHEFEINPAGGTLLGFNNQIYGLTDDGYSSTAGTSIYGSIYRLNPDGTEFQTIHSFYSPNGYGPSGSLIKALDGNLYGMTTYGGSGYSNGIVFSIQPDGTNFTRLLWFGGNQSVDGNPKGSLIQVSNGSFYGMTWSGGFASPGEAFRLALGIALDFQSYNIFCSTSDCSLLPVGSFVQASDGNLYAMTPSTGQGTGEGNIFRISTNGTNYTLLKKFNGTNGANPAGSLIQAPDGYLYGMTENGGLNGLGVIFKIRIDGTGFQKIFEFGQSLIAAYGSHPKGSLLLGSDKKLYGMAMQGGSLGAGTIFSINTNGTGFSVIYSFIRTNGAFPVGSLVEDVNTGFLFGMAEKGGTNNFGTIFKIKKDGTSFQKLLDFDGTNGKYPKGDLLIVVPGTPPPQKNPLAPSIEKNLTNNLISVSPNPARNSIIIRFQKQVSGKVTYSLADVQGKIVLQGTIKQASNAAIKEIDISRMPAGNYILELITPSEKVSKKIVKQ